jgi:endonuclease/exonuclease/phosphatase family metal-dependent hydrolase
MRYPTVLALTLVVGCGSPATSHNPVTPPSSGQVDQAASQPDKRTDKTPPVCVLTAPADGSTVSGTLSIVAKATDNVGVTRIAFDVDGNVLSSGTNSSTSWQGAAGAHTLSCTAYDAAGNVGVSATINVTVEASATSGGGSPGSTGGTTPPPASGRLRLMEGNLSTGNDQNYDNGEGGRIFHGLAPDIATIQEFNDGDNSASAIRAFVDANFGTEYQYFRETVSGSGTIPNGIVSRYPILDSGSWTDPNVSNRGFGWAEIDIPGDTNLWVVSTHLLTTSAANRDSEAKALIADFQANVPAGDFIALGGDFNTASRTEACLTTLSAVFSVTGPWPADNLGDANTSENRSKPHDWLITNAGLNAHEVPVAIGANSFANGLVVDTRVYTPLADIAPAELGDSGAEGMQHMAVVKDFSL